MAREQTAIILETVSFFAVTLDLFGKERLQRFQSAVENRMGRFKEVDLVQKFGRSFSPSPDEEASDFTYGLLLLIAVPICIGLYTYTMWRGFGVWLVQPVFFGLVTGFVVAYVAGVAVFAVVWLIERVLDVLLGVGVWVLTQARLEGVLLATGTVLFLAGQAISYANTGS